MIDVIGQLPHFTADQCFQRILREVITFANLLQQLGEIGLQKHAVQAATTVHYLCDFFGITITEQYFESAIDFTQWQKAA